MTLIAWRQIRALDKLFQPHLADCRADISLQIVAFKTNQYKSIQMHSNYIGPDVSSVHLSIIIVIRVLTCESDGFGTHYCHSLLLDLTMHIMTTPYIGKSGGCTSIIKLRISCHGYVMPNPQYKYTSKHAIITKAIRIASTYE